MHKAVLPTFWNAPVRVRLAGAMAHAALVESGGITKALPGFESTSFRLAGVSARSRIGAARVGR